MSEEEENGNGPKRLWSAIESMKREILLLQEKQRTFERDSETAARFYENERERWAAMETKVNVNSIRLEVIDMGVQHLDKKVDSLLKIPLKTAVFITAFGSSAAVIYKVIVFLREVYAWRP